MRFNEKLLEIMQRKIKDLNILQIQVLAEEILTETTQFTIRKISYFKFVMYSFKNYI
jgi:hypothetical protein